MALTQITTDGIKDGTITGTDLATNVDLVDNQKLRIGTGQDLQIYHDGNNSLIDNNTGDLLIRQLGSSGDIYLDPKSGERGLKVIRDGAVELYYDNSKKFETTNLGAKVTGELRLTDHLIMNAADNLRIYLGAGNDLQIYHDGSNSYINELGTGLLKILTNGLEIKNAADNTYAAFFGTSGASELYFNGSKKFETNSAGITVIGSENGDGEINLQADEGDDNADKWRLSAGANGAFTLKNFASGSAETNIAAVGNGAVELYQDNVKKFNTVGSGVQVTGSEFISEGTIYLQKSGAHHHRILSNDSGNDLAFQQSSSTGADDNFTTYLRINDGGNISLPVDNQKLRLGASADLQIYHDGSNSRILSSTGELQIFTHNFRVLNDVGNEIILQGAANANVELFSNNVRKFFTSSVGINSATHLPDTDNAHDLGASYARWDDVYATNGTIQTSDKNEKENISDTDLGLNFINKLSPKSFKFKNKTRTHYGLIAQDIETVITDLGKTSNEFAPLIKETIEDGTEKYGLRYTELIAPLIKAIQELSAEVAALKAG